jgi:FlaA1/EpsC-like NDP-sugar epimerase
MILNLVRRISSTGRMRKRAILMAYDLAAMLLALWGPSRRASASPTSRTIRSFSPRPRSRSWSGWPALYQLRIYHIVLRFFDLGPSAGSCSAAAIAATAWVILVYLMRGVDDGRRHRSWCRARSASSMAASCSCCCSWAATRWRPCSSAPSASIRRPRGRRNIAIYGANAAGISLAESVRRDRHYRLAAFVDDDPALKGQIIAGTQIHPPRALPTSSDAQ